MVPSTECSMKVVVLCSFFVFCSLSIPLTLHVVICSNVLLSLSLPLFLSLSLSLPLFLSLPLSLSLQRVSVVNMSEDEINSLLESKGILKHNATPEGEADIGADEPHQDL